jgi:hypothetical protein
MIRRALVAAAVLALPSVAAGQPSDLASLLLGRWEGDIQLHSTEDPVRTLVIEGVDTKNGTFRGKYATGRGTLRSLQGRVERVGSFVVIRFMSPQRGHAELRLIEDNVLMGEYHLREGSGGARTIGRPMRLQRIERPS